MEGGDINFDLINHYEQLLKQKTDELEITAEYGLELSQANEALQAEMQIIVHERDALRRLAESLQSQISAVRAELAHAQDMNESHEEEEGAGMGSAEAMVARRNVQEAQNKIKRLERELAQTQETIVGLEEAVEEGNERESHLIGQIDRLKAKIKSHEDEILVWQDQNEALQSQLAMMERSTAGEEELVPLRARVASLDGENAGLRSRVTSLLAEIKRLQEELESKGQTPRKMHSYESQGEEDLDLATPRNKQLSNAMSKEEYEDLGDLGLDMGQIDRQPSHMKSAHELELEANLLAAQEAVDLNELEIAAKLINHTFDGQTDLGSRLPVDPKSIQSFHRATRDGVVLCRLINWAHPETIDERVVSLDSTTEEGQDNLRLWIDSCKSVGCRVPSDLTPSMISSAGALVLVVQMVLDIAKSRFARLINVSAFPELKHVALPNETFESFSKLNVEMLIVRWFNYLLKENSMPQYHIKFFDDDLTDCEAIACTMRATSKCKTANFLRESNAQLRAQGMLAEFEAVYPKAFCYLTPSALLGCNKTLVFLFLASMFNLNHGLATLSKEEKLEVDSSMRNMHSIAQGMWREAEVFKLWMNSLGIDPQVENMFEDLRDGLILLKVLDILDSGAVQWSKVAQKSPVPKFMRLQNLNYVIKLCKMMKFSLVNIDAPDIEDGNPKMTLAVAWQMMRYHLNTMLMSLSSDGKPITDAELIKWANNKVEELGKKDMKMANFSQDSLKDSVFFLHLMLAIRPGSVQPDLIKNGKSDEDLQQNARYAITVARKLGACIYVCVEDITQVRPKFIFTFVAALMALTKEPTDKAPRRRPVNLAAPRALGHGGAGALKPPATAGATPRTARNARGGGGGDVNMSVPDSASDHRRILSQLKATEAMLRETLAENEQLKALNKQHCAEIGKLRAQQLGQFMLLAKHRQNSDLSSQNSPQQSNSKLGSNK